MTSALVLTFHKLQREQGRSEVAQDPAVERYTVSAKRFEEVIDGIPPKVCCTISEFLRKTEGQWLIFTFDDGFISDFEISFPLLRERGLTATFFITVGNVGYPGYATVGQLKEMAEAGMEIGSHGLTHRYLINVPRSEATREIRESKKTLEEKVGVKVTSFAPVGGHFQKWMLETAGEAGYRVFATMIPGRTRGGKEMLLMRRNHIQAYHDTGYVLRLLAGHDNTLIWNRLRYRFLNIPKAFLGMHNYDRTKGIILKTFLKSRN